jgi:hypothetical protein
MGDHERDGFIVRERAPPRVQFAIDGFFRAQQFARRDAEFGDEFAEFPFAERRGRVVDALECDAALTEQAAGFAAGASSRLFVESDKVVVHLKFLARGVAARSGRVCS